MIFEDSTEWGVNKIYKEGVVAYCKRMKVVEQAEVWVLTTLLTLGVESQRLH